MCKINQLYYDSHEHFYDSHVCEKELDEKHLNNLQFASSGQGCTYFLCLCIHSQLLLASLVVN